MKRYRVLHALIYMQHGTTRETVTVPEGSIVEAEELDIIPWPHGDGIRRQQVAASKKSPAERLIAFYTLGVPRAAVVGRDVEPVRLVEQPVAADTSESTAAKPWSSRWRKR